MLGLFVGKNYNSPKLTRKITFTNSNKPVNRIILNGYWLSVSSSCIVAHRHTRLALVPCSLHSASWERLRVQEENGCIVLYMNFAWCSL